MIRIAWNACARREWDGLLTGAGRSSLEQSWSYGEAVAARPRHRVDRAVVYHGDAPIAMVQVCRRTVLSAARLNRIVRGPIWLAPELSEAARVEACRAIRSAFPLRRREVLVWLPELPDDPPSHRIMRATGARRMVTGYSSVWVALSPDDAARRARLHGKWRNALRAAETDTLRITAGQDGRHLAEAMADYDRFRRDKRFLGPSGDFIRGIAEAGARTKDVLLLRALSGGRAVAGVVLIRHGASATYVAGWTSDEGRRRRAHNLLLWRGMEELRRAGAAWLDLGGVNPAAAPGIARFKLGLGGEVFTLAGTYL